MSAICMKLDPGMHIGLHLVFFGKTGVTSGTSVGSSLTCPADAGDGESGRGPTARRRATREGTRPRPPVVSGGGRSRPAVVSSCWRCCAGVGDAEPPWPR
jgi:hypothetical protein